MNESNYFDTAATTALDPVVLARMMAILSTDHANPASSHRQGQAVACLIEQARADIAAVFQCEPDEIIFTSGATEANNLALRGIALAHAQAGRHLITSAIEHKSVLACCQSLQRDGFDITYLSPERSGWITPEAVQRAIRPDTLLISLMHTNNETGVMQPVDEVAALAAEAGVLFHVDAAQAAGKFEIDLNRIPIDLLSFSAHKFHGPKGIGCLIIRNRRHLPIQPLLYGGGQEYGLRPGTLATHQVVGMSMALTRAILHRAECIEHISNLKHYCLKKLGECLSVQAHGDLSRSSPYILNFSIDGISSDALINQLTEHLSIASGSACSSGTIEPSHVLRAMAVEGHTLYGAVRLSFSRNHTITDIAEAVEHIIKAVRRMQDINTI